MTKFFTTNPVTACPIKEYQTTTLEELSSIITRARAAQKIWARLGIKERLLYFENLASILENEKSEIAPIISQEVGKPLEESLAEIDRCKMPLVF